MFGAARPPRSVERLRAQWAEHDRLVATFRADARSVREQVELERALGVDPGDDTVALALRALRDWSLRIEEHTAAMHETAWRVATQGTVSCVEAAAARTLADALGRPLDAVASLLEEAWLDPWPGDDAQRTPLDPRPASRQVPSRLPWAG